jgi:hypothetical protein
MRTLSIVAAALALSSCIPELVRRPVQFTSGALQEDPVQSVIRTLTAQGQTVAQADPQVGIVQTRWENTGFGYGFVSVGQPYPRNEPAVIWRRYTVTLVRREAVADVTVRADTQRCTRDAQTLDGVNILGPCTTLYADGLVPDHQQQLEALGAQLRASLGGR